MVKTNSVRPMLRMEIKEIAADGTFEGLLSPYGNIDHGGDLVEPGAYRKTIAERGNVIPMLWQHKKDIPIGVLELEDRADGLWCRGKLQMELPKAQEAYICLKNRIIRGLSIGYEAVKDSIENGIRHLKEIRLFEGSVVTFPMNELATVTSVKSLSGIKGDFNEELEEIQTLASFWQMQRALESALYSLVWADLDRDEKITLCGSVLEQFSESFTLFFPKYLDALEASYGPSETWESSVKPEIKAFLTGITVKSDDFLALLGNKAGTTTLPPKAAKTSSEPGDSHSAADDLSILADPIKGLRALIRA